MEKAQTIQIKSGIRQGPLYPYLFNIVLEVLSRAIIQLKEIKWYKLERRKSNSIFTNVYYHMIVYISDTHHFTMEDLQLIFTFSEVKEQV